MCSLTYREPTIILRSNACEHGLGGYCLNTGRAWRLEIPEELRNRATLNSLEFLAGNVAIEMEQLHGNLPRRFNVLSCWDSTTAAGSLRKSNFNDECPLQLWIARHLALMVITAGATVHSHWFPGKENNISDCCSRDHHLSDGDLTNLLYLHSPPKCSSPTNSSPSPPPDPMTPAPAVHPMTFLAGSSPVSAALRAAEASKGSRKRSQVSREQEQGKRGSLRRDLRSRLDGSKETDKGT